MFRKKLNVELGNFFYAISGIGNNIAMEEKLAMQKSITEVWEYFTKHSGKSSISTGISIQLTFESEEAKLFSDHFRSFEEFYLNNKSLFTPEIIKNIMLTSEAISFSYYDTNEEDTAVMHQLEKMFVK